MKALDNMEGDKGEVDETKEAAEEKGGERDTLSTAICILSLEHRPK